MNKSDGFVKATENGPFGRSEAGNLATRPDEDYVWWIDGHEKVFVWFDTWYESMPPFQLWLSDGDVSYGWRDVPSLEAARELAEAILAGTARAPDETI